MCHPLLRRSSFRTPPKQRNKKACESKKTSKWSENDLQQTIHVLDLRYSINKVCKAFSIPKCLLRDHDSGKVKDRKMGP